MIWLGILPSDVNDYNIPEVCGIDMTNADISICERMLREKNIITDHDRLEEQLKLMISSKKKFEIQSLNSIAFDYLSNTYLPKKLMEYDCL
jgi:DNA topoisomerase VI subunit A